MLELRRVTRPTATWAVPRLRLGEPENPIYHDVGTRTSAGTTAVWIMSSIAPRRDVGDLRQGHRGRLAGGGSTSTTTITGSRSFRPRTVVRRRLWATRPIPSAITTRGSGATFSLDGNLLTHGSRSFEHDALGRRQSKTVGRARTRASHFETPRLRNLERPGDLFLREAGVCPRFAKLTKELLVASGLN